MPHALIIDDSSIVQGIMTERLASLGFRSFDRAETEEQAIAAAHRRQPDLVVLGDHVAEGSGCEAARAISEAYGTPVILVTNNSQNARKVLRNRASLEGPFALDQISTAVDRSHMAPLAAIDTVSSRA
ncbi:response regulator [Altererythrobacter luteolus]|uniref:Response regulator n=1 Tax=Pontixanthobacter luteolus TaxID=295089 RepID=A0A6I4V3G6_9SPHN|nr:response regulator [Pontixanthobacter luteolus]MXP48255.1 response regulator [Pontixanthobacter luteolus]